jgi:hypothetical protein
MQKRAVTRYLNHMKRAIEVYGEEEKANTN